jgi:bacteriocin-like protein
MIMSELNNEICELSISELNTVSGGDCVGGPVRAPTNAEIRDNGGPSNPQPTSTSNKASFDPVMVHFS